MRAVPSRDGFFKTIGGDSNEATVLEQMRSYLVGLGAQLDMINAFYAANNLDS